MADAYQPYNTAYKSTEAVWVRIKNVSVQHFYKNTNMGVLILADSKIDKVAAFKNTFLQLA